MRLITSKRTGMKTRATSTHCIRDVNSWPLQTYLAFAPLPSAVPCARLHARLVVSAEWRLPDLAGDVETIVAELLSNALTASRRAPVHLWLVSDGRRVVISVADASPDPPVPMNPDGATEG